MIQILVVVWVAWRSGVRVSPLLVVPVMIMLCRSASRIVMGVLVWVSRRDLISLGQVAYLVW